MNGSFECWFCRINATALLPLPSNNVPEIEYSTDVWRYSRMHANLGIISEKYFLKLCTYTHTNDIQKKKKKERKTTLTAATSKVISLPTCFECTTSTISTLKHVRAMCLNFFLFSRIISLPVFPTVSVFCACLFEFHISLLDVYVWWCLPSIQTIEAKSVVTALLSNRSAMNKIKNNLKKNTYTHTHQEEGHGKCIQ